MNGRGKSDKPIVPQKLANNGAPAPVGTPAERVEGRGLAKGNPNQQNRPWTQGQDSLQSALDRIRQVAERDKEARFTALWHHVYDPDRLWKAYFEMKKDAAPGVDGQTWQQYGEDLENNLQDLSVRLQRGAYRAKPVRRVFIPKADGRQRPIGVPALEDKIVQRATTEVLNAVYETDFKGFSYGFRPQRGAHQALDALAVGIQTRKVSWVLDADIRGFFDAIDHEWMIRFVEHRIADRRVVRHVKKWLNAGVLEDGRRMQTERGTPQGGSVSPLLANLYLHHAFDLWADHWRQRHAGGDVIIVRYADDFVVGFQHRADAERFLAELKERLHKFALELHPDKTRVIEFGRFAAERRDRRGEGKPDTFDFLGFTHICGKTRNARFVVLRQTIRKRMQAKLKVIKEGLRRRMHWPVQEVGKWLKAVVDGYFRYHAVPRNHPTLKAFRNAVIRLWLRALRRRSQRARVTWKRMARWVDQWIPTPRILHPYPEQRLDVMTRGRSPVR
jgi:group II intron reverse transcriptase/maturase